MAGIPPDDLANQIAADTFTLTNHELAGKCGIAESTVRDCRLHRKRKLELAVGYGTDHSTVEQLPHRQAVVCSLAVTVERARWVAAPISLRGTDNVLVRLTGSVVQTDSADRVTVVLTNETTAY